MAKKWNMIIDIERCDNCRVCFLAAKDEHIGNEFPGYAASQPPQGHNWIEIERKERGSYPIVEANFMPVMCNHCDDAPCMKAATDGAVRKRDDGIVIIDPEKSKGQKAIVDACPYNAVSWNEERQIPQAWIFDAHLLDDGWTQTRAEQACPTGVFRSVKVEDQEMQQITAAEGLEVLQPELGTRPRVYYKNMHLMAQCFVSGSVAANIDGVEECAEGAEVILKQNGSEIGRATTDTFGEFKIDKLEKHSGQYELEVKGSTGSLSTKFELSDKSLYLGAIELA
ncbi:MAG: oxidoreductase [Gammaproteobacteria bacterium]|jgi:Fe-S-cluster-containing dehydrogenase component|nr:oxidoreductase [Gammaproteobacteria bacterium]HJP04975.1 4Fe-4S dicluster domain-containing protein [Gammaproteobacteria bacterium]